MYQHLLKNLYQDLLTFDREDCRKVRNLIKYLKTNKGQPIKMILEESYEFYLGYCYTNNIKPMTEWQYYLCKSELSW